MKKSKSIMILTLTVWSLTTLQATEPQGIRTNSEAVNTAGKVRMYTMRMLRDYLMIGQNLYYKDPASDLNKTIEVFENLGKNLRGYIKDPQLQSEMDQLQKLWEQSHRILATVPKKSDALALTKSAIRFRKKLNEFVNHLASKYGGTVQVINHAGRMRAVAESLVSVYLLKAWNIPEADRMLKMPMDNFRKSLDYLSNAKETTPQMRPHLKKLERIYLYFQMINEAGNTTTPVLAIKKTDQMLKLADDLTQLYVKELKH